MDIAGRGECVRLLRVWEFPVASMPTVLELLTPPSMLGAPSSELGLLAQLCLREGKMPWAALLKGLSPAGMEKREFLL